jgi:hypothetical protein
VTAPPSPIPALRSAPASASVPVLRTVDGCPSRSSVHDRPVVSKDPATPEQHANAERCSAQRIPCTRLRMQR